MNYLEAKFETLTPMFLGGADQSEPAIRPASVAGAIAFWWRALHAHKYVTDPTDLKGLQGREVQLFGGGKNQSRVLISCSTPEKAETSTLNAGFGRKYLGYGVVDQNAILAGTYFTVKIRFHPLSNAKNSDELNKKNKEELIAALKALGLFGGLGARVRRGWGSLRLVQLSDHNLEIKDRADFTHQVGILLGDAKNYSEDNLPFTAFGKSSLICTGPPLNKADDVHENLGLKYKEHKTGPIGLPKSGWKIIGPGAPDRRASPLWLTIRQLGNNFCPVIILFQNKFLPDGIQVTENGTNYGTKSVGVKAFQNFLDMPGNTAGPTAYQKLEWNAAP